MIEDQAIHQTSGLLEDTGCLNQGADIIALSPLAHPNETSA